MMGFFRYWLSVTAKGVKSSMSSSWLSVRSQIPSGASIADSGSDTCVEVAHKGEEAVQIPFEGRPETIPSLEHAAEHAGLLFNGANKSTRDGEASPAVPEKKVGRSATEGIDIHRLDDVAKNRAKFYNSDSKGTDSLLVSMLMNRTDKNDFADLYYLYSQFRQSREILSSMLETIKTSQIFQKPGRLESPLQMAGSPFNKISSLSVPIGAVAYSTDRRKQILCTSENVQLKTTFMVAGSEERIAGEVGALSSSRQPKSDVEKRVSVKAAQTLGEIVDTAFLQQSKRAREDTASFDTSDEIVEPQGKIVRSHPSSRSSSPGKDQAVSVGYRLFSSRAEKGREAVFTHEPHVVRKNEADKIVFEEAYRGVARLSRDPNGDTYGAQGTTLVNVPRRSHQLKGSEVATIQSNIAQNATNIEDTLKLKSSLDKGSDILYDSFLNDKCEKSSSGIKSTTYQISQNIGRKDMNHNKLNHYSESLKCRADSHDSLFFDDNNILKTYTSGRPIYFESIGRRKISSLSAFSLTADITNGESAGSLASSRLNCGGNKEGAWSSDGEDSKVQKSGLSDRNVVGGSDSCPFSSSLSIAGLENLEGDNSSFKNTREVLEKTPSSDPSRPGAAKQHKKFALHSSNGYIHRKANVNKKAENVFSYNMNSRRSFHTSRVLYNRGANPYETLGLSRNASSDEVKKKFKELAKKYHPDLNPSPDAKKKMSEITGAYEQLSDPQKRQFYDQTGMTMDDANNGGGGGGGFNPFGQGGGGGFASGGDASFMFTDFAEMFSRMSGNTSPFGGGQGTSRGEDIQTDVTIDFMAAMKGCKKQVKISRKSVCSDCNGDGCAPGTKVSRCRQCAGTGVTRVEKGPLIIGLPCNTCSGSGQHITHPCKSCKGSGSLPQTKAVNLNIPAGVRQGMEIRIPNEGNAGTRGGRSGHLFASINIKPHPVFKVVEDDLHVEVGLSLKTCLLGGEINVPTLDGNLGLNTPPKTPPGGVKVLKGKGCPRVDQKGNGDLMIHFVLQIPSQLTARQIELVQEFDDIQNGANTHKRNGDSKRGNHPQTNNDRTNQTAENRSPPPPPPPPPRKTKPPQAATCAA